ncbi:MAG: hypothetical protein ACPIOQ_54305 [Promethearchaeia archaeon]
MQRGAELTHKSLWRVLRSSRTLSSCCIPMRTAEGAAAALPESRSTPEGGVELKAVTVHTDAAREERRRAILTVPAKKSELRKDDRSTVGSG